MVAQIARLPGALRGLSRPVRAGLWLGCALALLYAMTLLTKGRSDGEWLTPPPRPAASAAPTEAPSTAWTDAPASVTQAAAEPEPAEAAAAKPAPSPEVTAQAAPEPAPAVAVAQSRKRSRSMDVRRASRRAAVRRAREPIQFHLADRPSF